MLISNQSQLSEILNAFSNSTFANAVTRIIITSLVISIFIQKVRIVKMLRNIICRIFQCYKIEPQVVFVLLCSSYFACTEPFLAGKISYLFYIKGESKVQVLGQGGACNSGPIGPNDLNFCMQGAFVG